MTTGGNLVKKIAEAVVDLPEQVQVQEVSGTQVTVLELKVAPGKVGQIIGRQGRMANAMRIILGAVGMKEHQRYQLEILE